MTDKKMNSRQKTILNAIIKEYIQTAEPVGSKVLVDKYNFDLSSATLRNEMKELEDMGFLTQPHTSAGRTPTDKGYRFFVDSLMGEKELTVSEQRQLQTELIKTKAKYNRLAKSTGKILSRLSDNLVISGVLGSQDIWEAGMPKLLKQPEFKNPDEVYDVAEALDLLDENVDTLCNKAKSKCIKVYIGKENPLHINNCSMIVSQIKYPSGEKGFIAIIGPKRMHYDKNISLLEHITKFLGSGLMIIVLANIVSPNF